MQKYCEFLVQKGDCICIVVWFKVKPALMANWFIHFHHCLKMYFKNIMFCEIANINVKGKDIRNLEIQHFACYIVVKWLVAWKEGHESRM